MVFKDRVALLKVRIAGKLLDIAESLPETKRGPISYLQLLRSFQRQHGSDLPAKAKAPQDNRISLGSMRLLEAYPIENFDGLQRAIERLFPNLPRDMTRSKLLEEMGQSIRSLNAGAWWNVGMLVRAKAGSIYAVPVQELPDLPPQVESISVAVHHMLPSMAVLTLDVRLTDRASDELSRVQSASYLPEITFRSIFRWQRGHSELPVEWVRQKHVRNWVDRLRAEIETALRRNVPPGRFGAIRKQRPRLPAIEVYLLSSGDFTSEEWQRNARWWLESFGMNSAFDIYRSEDALFQWPRVERHRTLVSGHMLVVSREKYLAAIKNPEAYSGERNAILHHVKDDLDGLMPVVVTLQVLQQTRKMVEELRERVFRRIDAGARFFRLRSMAFPLRLHDQLLGQSMLLSRLKAEFLRQQKWISNRMRGWEQLHYSPKHSEKDDLRSHAMQWIDREFETMEEHLGLARDAFAEYSTMRNTRAIFWLTVAVAGLTVVQVATSRDVRAWIWSVLSSISGWFR